jgi:Resolvase, N terminal domain
VTASGTGYGNVLRMSIGLAPSSRKGSTFGSPLPLRAQPLTRLLRGRALPDARVAHVQEYDRVHLWRCAMSTLLVGYARCSTDQQDLTAQHDGLLAPGVETERIYVDHGLTGTNREPPGLREALAACRAGDTLVVTKLDRLARSLPDARAIADELTTRQISLSLGGSVYDPTDAVGRLLFNVLAMVAEFEPT